MDDYNLRQRRYSQAIPTCDCMAPRQLAQLSKFLKSALATRGIAGPLTGQIIDNLLREHDEARERQDRLTAAVLWILPIVALAPVAAVWSGLIG